MQTVEWNPGRPWQEHPAAYRAPQMSRLAKWLAACRSGRSNLLGYLCHRLDILRTNLPQPDQIVILVSIDLSNLPARTRSAFYRVVLRAFYEIRHRLLPAREGAVTALFQTHHTTTDPHLSQSALRELLNLPKGKAYQPLRPTAAT